MPPGRRCCALSFCVLTELFNACHSDHRQEYPDHLRSAFAYVSQTDDFDDVFACCAMLAGKTIEEVREIAIAKTKHPARGPYYLGATQIAALLAQLGFVATV
jgi:hypothetical protein